MEPFVAKALALKPLSRVYRSAQEHHAGHPDEGTLYGWFDSLLTSIKQTYQVEAPPDFQIPPTGPLIIVSNRPFGLLEPIILGHFISQVRPDLKIMANELLAKVEEFHPYLIQVKTSRADGTVRRNIAPLKEALRFVSEGGALMIFPAGEVAHYRPGKGIAEKPWTEHVGALARRTGAAILPVYFPGHNSLLFQATGLLHRHLRSGLIVRELLKRKSQTAVMRLGQIIPATRLKKFENDASRTSYVRLQTLVLEKRDGADPAAEEAQSEVPVAKAVSRELLLSDLRRLQAKGCELTRQGTLTAYIAEANEMPYLLREIGRLREITFREVGEGTGGEIDLDRYDTYYLHLFVWDEEKQQIAGAYRLGRAKQILADHGAKGLYTNTLFRFQKPFLSHLDDAVEMGRSFVCSEYQRNTQALPLLWKAVMIWLGRSLKYRKLFGPVSISKDYDAVSKRLIVEFLTEHHRDDELAAFVKPRKPFRSLAGGKLVREFVSSNLEDVDDCSAVIASLETDGKGIPVLLKHYLKLNGTILSFNVDKEFSNVLDGLIMVDMMQTDPRLPLRLMGRPVWEAYQKFHEAAEH